MAEKTMAKSEATKARILHAAAVKFSQKSYDNTSTREIGELAKANIGLLNRYFGSKEELFRQAVIPALTVAPNLTDDRSKTAEHLGTITMQKAKTGTEEFDPMKAILLSLGSDTAGPMIREALTTKVIGEIRDHIGGKDAETRAALIAAILFGVDAIFRVMEVGPDEENGKRALSNLIAGTLSRLIEPPLDERREG